MLTVERDVYVTSAVVETVYPPKDSQFVDIEIQNVSANDIYVLFGGGQPGSRQGMTIPTNVSRQYQSGIPPQGPIKITGSQATQQQVKVFTTSKETPQRTLLQSFIAGVLGL